MCPSFISKNNKRGYIIPIGGAEDKEKEMKIECYYKNVYIQI